VAGNCILMLFIGWVWKCVCGAQLWRKTVLSNQRTTGDRI